MRTKMNSRPKTQLLDTVGKCYKTFSFDDHACHACILSEDCKNRTMDEELAKLQENFDGNNGKTGTSYS